MQEFLQNYAKARLRPSTIRGYTVNAKKHILPILGDKDVLQLSAGDLDELNDKLGTLSNKSKVYVHATLRKALNYGIKRGYLYFNPYKQFDMPKAERYKYTTLNEDQIYKVLSCVRGTELEGPVILALKYGVRRGEALGVRAEDIDGNILHIQRSKTREGQRDIYTPCKTKESNRYILLSEEDSALLYRYAKEHDTSLSPTALDKKFNEFMRKQQLPTIRFHDLRHTYATYMLKKGINPKIVQTVLGHSKIDTTLDIYSHPDTSMQQLCLAAWEQKNTP